MTTNYPNHLDDTATLPHVSGSSQIDIAINNLIDAVIAVETELGIDPKSIYADVRSRLDALEARSASGGGADFSSVTTESLKSNAGTLSISTKNGLITFNVDDVLTGFWFLDPNGVCSLVWNSTTTGIFDGVGQASGRAGSTRNLLSQGGDSGYAGGDLTLSGGPGGDAGSDLNGNINTELGAPVNGYSSKFQLQSTTTTFASFQQGPRTDLVTKVGNTYQSLGSFGAAASYTSNRKLTRSNNAVITTATTTPVLTVLAGDLPASSTYTAQAHLFINCFDSTNGGTYLAEWRASWKCISGVCTILACTPLGTPQDSTVGAVDPTTPITTSQSGGNISFNLVTLGVNTLSVMMEAEIRVYQP